MKELDSSNVGISILITAFRAEKFIRRTLDSVERSMRTHKKWALIVCVDGYDEDKTLEIVRAHSSKASRCIVLGFPKARNIAVAKTRCVDLARTIADEFPYITWQDADDEMLSGKIEFLFPKMIEHGCLWAGGDFLDEGVPGNYVDVSHWWYSYWIGTWAFILHTSLIPEKGLFDVDQPQNCMDDWYFWQVLRKRGLEPRGFPGVPVYHVRSHEESYTAKIKREFGWDQAMKISHEYFGAIDEPWPGTAVMLAAGDRAIHESRLAIATFRLFHPNIPLKVYCLTSDMSKLDYLGFPGVSFHPLDSIWESVSQRISVTRQEHGPWKELYIGCGAKLEVIREVSLTDAPILYFDSDFIWMNRMNRIPDSRFVLCPESVGEQQRSTWSMDMTWGGVNGGLFIVRDKCEPVIDHLIDIFWEDSPGWHPSEQNTVQAGHSGFTDQNHLMLIPDMVRGKFRTFHPGCNVGITSFIRHAHRFRNMDSKTMFDGWRKQVGLETTNGHFWYKGYPLVALHGHTWWPSYHPEWTDVIYEAIMRSSDHESVIKFLQTENTTNPRHETRYSRY